LSQILATVAVWYLFPQYSFVAIPGVIVLIYAMTIFALEQRWKNINRLLTTVTTNSNE